MAFSVKKYNNKKFDLSPAKDTKYVKLSELDPEQTYIVGAFYVNTRGKFGDSPVAAIVDTDPVSGELFISMLANLPRFQLDAVKEMMDDAEAIEAINGGRVGFTVRSYYSETYAVDCFAAEWVDV